MNDLVDPNSQFHWGDYLPVGGGEHGGTSRWNPFTPGQGYTTNKDGDFDHWLSGLPVFDNAQSTLEDIRKSDDQLKAIVDMSAAIADGAGLYAAKASGDWGGLVIAPVASWIMEHVKPLRLLLDELTGNQDMVNAVANTWENMSRTLGEAVTLYHKLVQETRDFWNGPGSDGYRNARARALGAALAVASIVCQGWSLLVRSLGESVKIVHDLVRDLIAALIGQLVQDAVHAATVVGAATIPEQSAGEIARVTALVTKAVLTVVEEAGTTASMVGKFYPLLSEAISIVERFTGKKLPIDDGAG